MTFACNVGIRRSTPANMSSLSSYLSE